MIIGNGLIANSIKDTDDKNYIFFASGVSNSSVTNPLDFEREFRLIKELHLKHENKIFVYFSSCYISNNNAKLTPYYVHKLKMEEYIANNHFNYLILRLPQVIGKSNNNNTLINNFIYKLSKNEIIKLQRFANRYFIDVLDISEIIKKLITLKVKNEIIDIFYPKSYNLIEIIEILELCSEKKINYKLINEGISYSLTEHLIYNYGNLISNSFDDNYLLSSIKKHYFFG
jgi:nucleoside-diphosphate-sugar epimerase